jgi:serine/threonine protein kinase
MGDTEKTSAFRLEPADDGLQTDTGLQQVGRYRIQGVLGQGSFGLVYLGHDDQLQRPVAIKVPHGHRVSNPEDAEAYLTEARTVAQLDHPNIVPVYDTGVAPDCPCFIVSKFVEGRTLAQCMGGSRYSAVITAQLVATLADALNYAHCRGLVHRDIKPGNILIDGSGRPYIVDFGLALREEDVGQGSRYAGTPSYMSPEQARGEGHRVDGRSDIFSLGIVMYELLAGRKPFAAEHETELREQIRNYEPRPLRHIDEHIPRELERICFKALAKRASERYMTARDLADDLQHFLNGQSGVSPAQTVGATAGQSLPSNVLMGVSAAPGVEPSAGPSLPATQQPASTRPGPDSQPSRIVPKGLRAFDDRDADFFLELLPGPRDRDGLPDVLRFWKTRIEEQDSDLTFSVGLLYGPSGCGKSSLVKAGLLPRLTSDVVSVYVEATPGETTTRLLSGLRKRCPSLQNAATLKDVLAEIRRGRGLPHGRKMLIILDQFEQWLHSAAEHPDDDLVQALRQCDGGRVQCLLLVRDDFWLAVSRFLRELEVRLLEGQNSALVDLFDADHATRVLTAFGRAFGRLPDQLQEMSREQKDFVQQSVRGLSQGGKIICVRLALFAEMMKSRPWTTTTLREVGGTQGVGFTFLEETFSASTGSAEHRFHQVAARAVLKALLPDSGSDIKGVMKSFDELLKASGYGDRREDFEDLIHILDSELRLITPTEPLGTEAEDPSSRGRTVGKYYQLSHDYLVHSIRDWLTRKQKETRRGRAELLLAERSLLWNTTRENRFLPSFWEFAAIRRHSHSSQWTDVQSAMMHQAGRIHGIRLILLTSMMALVALGGLSIRNAVNAETRRQESVLRSEGLVDALANAKTSQVPGLVAELQRYREWADPILKTRLQRAGDSWSARLHLSMALLPVDAGQADSLVQRLPGLSVEQLPVVCAALKSQRASVAPPLWQLLLNDQSAATDRFQAACALAMLVPIDPQWSQATGFVASHLVNEVPTLFLGQRLEQLHSVRSLLIPSLMAAFRDRTAQHAKQRVIAATSLASYLNNQPESLAELILEADTLPTFSPLVDALRPHASVVQATLEAVMNSDVPPEATDAEHDKHRMKQSLAGTTLVHLGAGDSVWPLLEFSQNPSLRSHLIRNLSRLQVASDTVTTQLAAQSSVSVRRALIQILGGLDATRLPENEQQRVIDGLRHLYLTDPDPGIHAASLWAMKQWGSPLPETPTGMPQPSSLLEERIAGLSSQVAETAAVLREFELEWRTRQRAWERLLLETPPATPSGDLKAAFYFPLDEKSEPVTDVTVPPATPGVYQGPGTPVWAAGVFGQALVLDGQGGCINTGIPFDVDTTDSFSWGCWFCTTQQKPMALLAKMEPPEKNHRGFDILLNQGLVQAHIKHVWPANVVKVVASPRVDDGAWHHVLVSWNGSSLGSGLTIYIDGRPVDSDIATDTLAGTIRNTVPLLIGSRGWGEHFTGQIDDVRVFDRLVNAAEVRQIYDAGVRALAGVAFDDRTEPQQNALRREYQMQDQRLQQLRVDVRDAQRVLRREKWSGLRLWSVNSQGQHLVVIPDPADVGKQPFDYSFALSMHEVTVEQFRRFIPQHRVDNGCAAEPDCPVHFVSWFEAAAYCNWLSEQDGLPKDQWCYEPAPAGDFAEGMVVKPGYLQLTGYRLPTLLEWECACRSGTTSKYYFGEAQSLLDDYGWHAGNATGQSHSAGSLLPNDLGLFDMHGNVWEWCQDALGVTETGIVSSRQNRTLAGGAYSINRGNSTRLNSSERPTYRGTNIGFRLARTIR